MSDVDKSDTEGIRRRKVSKPVDEEDNDEIEEDTVDENEDAADADYGYAGSDADNDSRLMPNVLISRKRGESSESEYLDKYQDAPAQADGQYDDEDSEDEDLRLRYPALAAQMLDAPKEDDTAVLVAGAVGFFLSIICAGTLPAFGLEQDYVMSAGLVTLLCYIMWVSFCPTCGSAAKRNLAPIEQVTPQAVFIVAACVGTMMGGLLGGGVRYAFPEMWRK